MRALFIGRFQPFHKGHLLVIKDILKKYDEIVIGIGSSQYKNTIDNPFSYNERVKMIINTLEKEGISKYQIVAIPDIHNPPKWVEHVLSIFSDFDVVVTNNSLTKKLFFKKGIKVDNTPLFYKEKYSGKKIRKKIRNNKKFEELVPEPVLKVIKDNNCIQRIKKISD